MKRLRAWLGSNLVPVLACAALVFVAASWIGDVFYDIHPAGTLPLFYDISLAFLTGCFFQLLVVTLPAHRRARETIQAHRGRLMMIANTGPSLLSDLEFVGRCPPREMTDDHLEKVLTATYENMQVQALIRDWLLIAHEEYQSAVPYLFALPHEVSVALERVEQSSLPGLFRYRFPAAVDPMLEGRIDTLREPRPVLKMASDGAALWERKTLVDYLEAFKDYRDACAALTTALEPYLSGPRTFTAVERVHMIFRLRLEEPESPKHYPKDAFSVAWAGDEPTIPPHMVDQFKKSPRERRPD